jgi:hypothetical protein
MYDPSIGRWLSEDPTGFQAADADLYRYVNNDPTNATDPTGLVAAYSRPYRRPFGTPDIHFDQQGGVFGWWGSPYKTASGYGKLIVLNGKEGFRTFVKVWSDTAVLPDDPAERINCCNTAAAWNAGEVDVSLVGYPRGIYDVTLDFRIIVNKLGAGQGGAKGALYVYDPLSLRRPQYRKQGVDRRLAVDVETSGRGGSDWKLAKGRIVVRVRVNEYKTQIAQFKPRVTSLTCVQGSYAQADLLISSVKKADLENDFPEDRWTVQTDPSRANPDDLGDSWDNNL